MYLFPDHLAGTSFEYFIIYLVCNQDHPPDFSLQTSPPVVLSPQALSACVFMFLLSIHGDLQLGKYSVYNTLCLQLTLLINCNRNTAISSLIAGRIQLYISSLSRTQNLWLPNFQWRGGRCRKFSKSDPVHWKQLSEKRAWRPNSVAAPSTLRYFWSTSKVVFVAELGTKGKFVRSLPLFLFCPFKKERSLKMGWKGSWLADSWGVE